MGSNPIGTTKYLFNMALWNVNNEIVYSNGPLIMDPDSAKGILVRRHTYKVPYSNVGKGGFLEMEGKKFHTPSWIEVHPETTLDDIVVEKNPFEELFVEPKVWEFKSESSDKVYQVKLNSKGNLSCSCWGYIAHKKCKHINNVKQK